MFCDENAQKHATVKPVAKHLLVGLRRFSSFRTRRHTLMVTFVCCLNGFCRLVRRYLWREAKPQKQVLSSFCSVAQTRYGWGSTWSAIFYKIRWNANICRGKHKYRQTRWKHFSTQVVVGVVLKQTLPANNADEAGKGFHQTILPQMCVVYLLLWWKWLASNC